MRALLLILAAAVSVQATLTVDSRYTVTPFITGWNGVAGTFNALGDYYFYDLSAQTSSGLCLYKISHTEMSSAPFSFSSIRASHTVGCPDVGFADIVSTGSNRLYLSSGWELDAATGAAHRRWVTSAVHGIALDPTDQSLLFVDYAGMKVYRVPNPDTSANTVDITSQVTLFLDTALPPVGSGIDGLTVGPDGTVYMSAYDSLALIIATRKPDGTVNTVTSVPLLNDDAHTAGSGPDGISICGDASYAVTTRGNGQRLTFWNLTAPYAEQNIATSNGGDGPHWDWSSVGTDGCIYFSTEANIFKLGLADGGCPCFSVQAAVTPCEAVAPAVAGGSCVSASVTSAGQIAKLTFASNTNTGPCNFRDSTPIGA